MLQLERHATPERALAFFDGLPPVGIDQLRGAWRGTVLATGHPLDRLLARLDWYGKRFEDPDAVHPLVMGQPGRLFSITPSFMPLGWLRRNARLLELGPVSASVRLLLRLLRTDKPQARLRMTEFRGVRSATMIYDTLPIHDIFRSVDDITLLGAMDARGDDAPHYLYFVLRREQGVDAPDAGAGEAPRRDFAPRSRG